MTIRYDACVLAGGLARRLDGRDKPGLRVSGRPLVESVAAAVSSAERLVIVGPSRPGLPRAVFRREDPPGGGPVPALRAGLAEMTAPWTALLAADLPFLTAGHVTALLEAAAGRPGTEEPEGRGARERSAGEPGAGEAVREPAPGRSSAAGAVLLDDEGREQWLAGVWRTESLARALARYEGRSLRGLLAPLSPITLHLPGRPWFDCDTMDDLQRARATEPGSDGEDANPSRAPRERHPHGTATPADEE
ncbi:molybdenum cofactor guanylyltransferase [Streptosporangium longisporum]|uniref:MobA-like NTP transferase domain-containing protein n=1 Tax=Streptosporangium longisporum TaxID=46187 RepID=A0ABP6L3U6_9ACTN